MIKKFKLLFCLLCLTSFFQTQAQHSIAREWNEVLLQSIRSDFARPTVHARNLYHLSAMMYDLWALHEEGHATYFIGRNVEGYSFPSVSVDKPDDVDAFREQSISYAAYRLLSQRFQNSPGHEESQNRFDEKMRTLNFDPEFASEDYQQGSPAAAEPSPQVEAVESCSDGEEVGACRFCQRRQRQEIC